MRDPKLEHILVPLMLDSRPYILANLLILLKTPIEVYILLPPYCMRISLLFVVLLSILYISEIRLTESIIHL